MDNVIREHDKPRLQRERTLPLDEDNRIKKSPAWRRRQDVANIMRLQRDREKADDRKQ